MRALCDLDVNVALQESRPAVIKRVHLARIACFSRYDMEHFHYVFRPTKAKRYVISVPAITCILVVVQSTERIYHLFTALESRNRFATYMYPNRPVTDDFTQSA